MRTITIDIAVIMKPNFLNKPKGMGELEWIAEKQFRTAMKEAVDRVFEQEFKKLLSK